MSRMAENKIKEFNDLESNLLVVKGKNNELIKDIEEDILKFKQKLGFIRNVQLEHYL